MNDPQPPEEETRGTFPTGNAQLAPEENLRLQYEKLIQVGLHYDQKLWLIPGAAYSLSVAVYHGIFSADFSSLLKPIFALVNLLVFGGFFLQLIKDRTFQLGNQEAIDQVKEKLGMVETKEFTGLQPASEKDRWFIKITRTVSAFNCVAYIMLFTLIFHFGVAIYLAYIAIACE